MLADVVHESASADDVIWSITSLGPGSNRPTGGISKAGRRVAPLPGSELGHCGYIVREVQADLEGEFHMTGDISGGSGLPVLITLVIVAAMFVSILVWSTRSRRHDRS